MSQTDPTTDPFDLAALRLSQDFAKDLGVAKKLLTVPVRKPHKTEFVRVHPDPAYHLDTALIELKGDRTELYLVAPDLRPGLAAEPTVVHRRLVTAVSRQGVVFLWPLRLPGPDGRLDEWSRSALDAAALAETAWARVTANLALGAYEVAVAAADVGAPQWPAEPFQGLVRIAFRDRLVDRYDHPVLRQLRGDA